MKYDWMRDGEQQKRFNVTWAKGSSNEADLFSKIHPKWYQSERITRYILDKLHKLDENIAAIVSQYSMDRSSLQGCVDT